MKLKCPTCGAEAESSENHFRPFCSERCRLLDLDSWLSGTYSVPAVEGESEDEAADPQEDPGKS